MWFSFVLKKRSILLPDPVYLKFNLLFIELFINSYYFNKYKIKLKIM